MQCDPEVWYLTRRGTGAILLTESGIRFRGNGPESITLSFSAGQKPRAIEALEPTGGTSNYFFGIDSRNWRTNIPNFLALRYREIYRGIDVVFRGRGRNTEYDFIVAPQADPNQIEMDFSGAKALRISEAGDLIAIGNGFEIVHRKPAIYQTHEGIRHDVSGNFVFRDRQRVAFQLGEYDPTEVLVIDPVVSYSAIIGGSGAEVAQAVAVDAAGNAYVAGNTTSNDFPFVAGSLRNAVSGTAGLVYKLDPSGTTLLYSAIVAGMPANAIAVDQDGNAYAAGAAPGPNGDAGVFKLNASGSALLYSFSFGGSFPDFASGIAIDSTGNAYVTGSTSSTNFPTTSGAFETSTGSVQTSFVAKVNPTGTALVYSTFLGGQGLQAFDADTANAIAVDAAGNAYVAGSTNSGDFPVTP